MTAFDESVMAQKVARQRARGKTSGGNDSVTWLSFIYMNALAGLATSPNAAAPPYRIPARRSRELKSSATSYNNFPTRCSSASVTRSPGIEQLIASVAGIR